MRRVDSLEKTLMLGGLEDRSKRGWQRMRWLDCITDSMEWVWVNSGSWWWIGRPGVLRFMGSHRVGQDWATEMNWTELRIWDLSSALMSSENSYHWFLSRVKIHRLELSVLWPYLEFYPLWKYSLRDILPHIRASCGSSQFVTFHLKMHTFPFWASVLYFLF